MLRLEPLRDVIVVRLLPEPPKDTRIIAVHLTERPSVHAEVVSVGPDVRDVQVGQEVIVSRLQGFSVDLGEPFVLLREQAVLAYV